MNEQESTVRRDKAGLPLGDEQLTDADVAAAIRDAAPGYVIEHLDTRLGTSDVVALLKGMTSYTLGTCSECEDGPYPAWSRRTTRVPQRGYLVEVRHGDRVIREGLVRWNRIANNATVAALERRREAAPGEQMTLQVSSATGRRETRATARTTERGSAMSEGASATKERKPLVLDRAVRNTLDGSTIVKSKRSQQRHVLPADTTRTLCGIDTAKWSARDEVTETTVNCPLCAEALKAEATKAKAEAAEAKKAAKADEKAAESQAAPAAEEAPAPEAA